MVELLPNMYKLPGFIPSTQRKEEEKKGKGRKGGKASSHFFFATMPFYLEL